MTNEEFENKLISHDWYYYFSDDPRWYHSGETSKKQIDTILRSASDDLKRIYNKYHAKHFRTTSFYEDLSKYKYPFPDLTPLLPEP